ncbi:MAG: DALR domain-containing protein, partial [Patescibacteria group bacterium]
TLRLMFLMSHYRSPVDYTKENLKQAEAATTRIKEFLDRLHKFESAGENLPLSDESANIKKIVQKIITALDDDFDTPKAISLLFDYIHLANREIDNRRLVPELDIWRIFGDILGILPTADSPNEIPDEVKLLTQEREEARQTKNFTRSDELREKIKNLGYELDDTSYGPLIKKI